MVMFEENELLEILHSHNRWWTASKVPEGKLEEFKRRDFFKLQDALNQEEITAIIGARRVGKTILIHQLIENLLEQGIDSKRILYLSIDDAYLKLSTGKPLLDVFDTYSKYILHEDLKDLNQQVYFFLDEIQYLDGWESVLKRWYDLKFKLKFIVSGSSSTSITKGSSEALLGRVEPRIVMPLKFLEKSFQLRYIFS